MILYFDFEERRRTAEVIWPKGAGTVQVTLRDRELMKQLPPDLLFDISRNNKISFIEENPDNKRLVQLQKSISRKLQECVNQL